MTDLRITLLGSGGGYPCPQRQTAAVLVRHGDRGVIIDAGTGISNLRRWSLLSKGINSWSVVLTSFDFRNLIGLAWLPADLRPEIYAPGSWLFARPSTDVLAGVFSPPVAERLSAGIVELQPGKMEIEGLGFQFFGQPGSAAALSLAEHLAYAPSAARILPTRAEVLLLGADYRGPVSGEFSEVMITHRTPEADPRELLARAREINANGDLAVDGWTRRFRSLPAE